jgi:hypothetical protein
MKNTALKALIVFLFFLVGCVEKKLISNQKVSNSSDDGTIISFPKEGVIGIKEGNKLKFHAIVDYNLYKTNFSFPDFEIPKNSDYIFTVGSKLAVKTGVNVEFFEAGSNGWEKPRKVADFQLSPKAEGIIGLKDVIGSIENERITFFAEQRRGWRQYVINDYTINPEIKEIISGYRVIGEIMGNILKFKDYKYSWNSSKQPDFEIKEPYDQIFLLNEKLVIKKGPNLKFYSLDDDWEYSGTLTLNQIKLLGIQENLKSEIKQKLSTILSFNSPQFQDIALLPFLDTNGQISGIDFNIANKNIASFRNSNYFTKEFQDNYLKILKSIDSKIKRNPMLWNDGIPPTDFNSNTSAWCFCQDIPSPNDHNTINIDVISINEEEAELTWSWYYKTQYHEDFKYKVRVKKENGIWKINYLEGFDINLS